MLRLTRMIVPIVLLAMLPTLPLAQKAPKPPEHDLDAGTFVVRDDEVRVRPAESKGAQARVSWLLASWPRPELGHHREGKLRPGDVRVRGLEMKAGRDVVVAQGTEDP